MLSATVGILCAYVENFGCAGIGIEGERAVEAVFLYRCIVIA